VPGHERLNRRRRDAHRAMNGIVARMTQPRDASPKQIEAKRAVNQAGDQAEAFTETFDCTGRTSAPETIAALMPTTARELPTAMRLHPKRYSV